MKLKGSRSLITGASRGIGAAIARRLAAAGSEVILVSRSAGDLQRECNSIREAGGKAEFVPTDLRDPVAVAQLIHDMGEIDVLVNNAAAEPPGVSILDSKRSDFEESFEVGFWASYALIRGFGPGMAQRRQGSIIQVSSVGGTSPMPGQGPYCCTKAAMEMLTRVVAMELGPAGVRCNAVRPGPVMTQMFNDTVAQAYIPSMSRAVPLGRFAGEAEIAEVVAWLACEDSSYVTGQIINADGGMTAGQFLLAQELSEP